MERTINWNEVQGNPGLTGLHPSMLTESGHIAMRATKIKGESKKEKIPVQIIFDESYIHYYVITKIIRPLGITKYNDLQKIISNCWNEYKKQKN